MGYVLRSPALTDNMYFILGYFLVALTAYYVARYLGLRREFALLVGVLYSFLPYHQVHGETHVTRSAYYVVPLVVLAMLWLLSWRTQLYVRAPDGTSSWHRKRIAVILAICVVQGVSDTITSGFAITLFVILGLLTAVAERDSRPLKWSLVFSASIAGTLLLANAPFVVARLTQGPNLAAGRRTLVDQQIYALRWIFMLLPVEHHIGGFLSRITAKASSGGHGEPGQSLGLLGAIGFAVSAVICLGRAVGGNRIDSRLRRALQNLGLLGVVAVLVASVGGLDYGIALTGFNLLRTWDRIVVIIGFAALVAFGLLLQSGMSSWGRRRAWSRASGRSMPVIAVALLMLVGVVDQAPRFYSPNYASTAQQYDIDAAFFNQLEASVPPGSMIFQYPIMAYPENGPVNNLLDYGEFVGYLHTSTLQWSYGAMKGRTQGDWQTQTLANLPVTTQLAALSAIGFQGVWVDRAGYSDGGAGFIATLTPLLGAPSVVSSDNRMLYFGLAPMTRRVDARLSEPERKAFATAVLTATSVQFGSGFYQAESDGDVTAHWAARTSTLSLVNEQQHAETVTLTAQVRGNGPGSLEVSDGGDKLSVPMTTSHPTSLHMEVSVPERGTRDLTLVAHVPARVDAPADPRQLWVQLAQVDALPQPAYQAMCQFETGSTRPTNCPTT